MLSFGRYQAFAARGVEISARAADLVLGSTVIDMLGLLTLDWLKLFRWQRLPHAFDLAEFRQLEQSGIDIFHPAVEAGKNDPPKAARVWMNGWKKLLGSRICFLAPVVSTGDLVRLPSVGKVGIVVGLQNSVHFERVADVRSFFDQGQRVSQLTYNARNRLGSGCYESRDRGLTSFGREIVGEMNQVGMAVDISHCGERTSLEAIEASRKPVLVTHSNCRALVPRQPRCKSDEVIRRMAARGGVIGMTNVKAFVGASSPTLEDLLNHFVHVAKLVGVEHVGLGSDVDVKAIDPVTGRPAPFYVIRGLDPVARIFQIADGLLRRGFAPRDIELILGGNFRRALAEIWPADPRAPRGLELRRDPFCPAPVKSVPGEVVAK
jgi:membrane dipeptidase